jgi:hypothetical protein
MHLKGTENFDLNDITQEDVRIYRHIYYEYAKPLMRCSINFTDEQISNILTPMVNDIGWTLERYHMFSQLDLMQRFAERNYPEVYFQYKDGTRMSGEDMNPLLSIPRLRCPLRTEQKD